MTDTPSPPLPSQNEPLAAEPESGGAAPGKVLSQAALRAIEEANARRAARLAPAPGDDRDETGGPAGPDPTRFGDWERKGLAIDF